MTNRAGAGENHSPENGEFRMRQRVDRVPANPPAAAGRCKEFWDADDVRRSLAVLQ